MVKDIKQEISETGGICAAPLNVTDVSLECVRHLIPASLYLLLSLMITFDITDKTDERKGLQSRCAPSQILNGSILPLIEAGIS